MMALRQNLLLRDKLAAEYVLGTLHGRARARFRSVLKYDADLRALVADWEARLTPLATAAREIDPPARVWQKIVASIQPSKTRAGWWLNLSLWRGLAIVGACLALTAGIYIGIVPAPEPRIAMVAVLSDAQSRPAMVVTEPLLKPGEKRILRVRIVQDHPAMAANTSWELWMLPTDGSAPVSLGLIGLEPVQLILLKTAKAQRMIDAWGIALSIEPKGGSPTGVPTGPVIFKGPCVRIT